jgi:CRISPR/Cas system-associated protein Csm6
MFKRWSRLALFFGLAIQISGCAGAALLAGGAAGAGAVVWVRGKLEHQFSVPLSRVYPATLAALKEFELAIQEEKKDKLAAEIQSQLADGKRVWIDMCSLTESSTKITIRIGMFGDRSRSRRLLEAIRRHL